MLEKEQLHFHGFTYFLVQFVFFLRNGTAHTILQLVTRPQLRNQLTYCVSDVNPELQLWVKEVWNG